MPEKQDKKSQNGELQQIADTLKDANNVLVTIGTDPTVDQFAACIGLTLVLNKLGKHATAVFSGAIPSTIEFLKPEKTIEKNTDSLRDFIIALDKSKADKLRYKVEDDVVKIFITPYKTSINEDDLKFSQGDFNVDVVMALGIHDKKHLDQAIVAHGRILHDATVASVNSQAGGHIGAVDWTDSSSSSLCEMVTDIVQSLSSEVFDEQNANALLTGIVAETDRYSNDKATPHTMSVAGVLMSAGASTQLVSNELDSGLKAQTLPEPVADSESEKDSAQSANDGSLEIDHSTDSINSPSEEVKTPENDIKDDFLEKLDLSNDHSTDQIESEKAAAEPSNTPDENRDTEDFSAEAEEDEAENNSETTPEPVSRIIKDPPQFSGKLTANSEPEEAHYSGSSDPLSNVPENQAIFDQKKGLASSPAEETKSDEKLEQTLRDIEESIGSPHLSSEDNPQPDQQVSSEPTPVGEVAQLSVDEARKAAEQVAGESDSSTKPREDIGSLNLDSDVNAPDSAPANSTPPPPPVPPPVTPPISQP